MKKLYSTKARVVVLPILGFAGAVFVVLWPEGHAAFCSSFPSVLL